MNLFRNDDRSFPAYTWPGGYPLVYITADGAQLCPACANQQHGSGATDDPDADAQWRLIGCDVHWEGPPRTCDHCATDIPSAYGDPNASDKE